MIQLSITEVDVIIDMKDIGYMYEKIIYIALIFVAGLLGLLLLENK